ncbi:dihydrolipoyl dehydrogenase [[Clostridium] bifermentans ATCC 638]|uniref:Dihydrolipoyl dehydrogenase n=1 Tax=Paraclostridium bifermentans ATCC 638 = DSM 14991 TaxID=1233171 RepID=T4VVC8_PARBF|nr:dihydrolipoyl dehydrogenase [Paraclostridium bifermentans]EQK44751.1 dihydrolipoyl dehydrogenase [[Clostridium] bifermentans ATCC 638] [Paraclostridium bifermentans ATCC 638 = DSM 14991]RIZ58278.1 dihydrolipoyl dehydrogenase [Paraclostridium bifermentans]UAG17853.1 dihydrolipoyl dehydrogenase [Paraclostridium bifermentans]
MKVAVIGGGPGGYVAAIKAAMLGAEVTVIEKRKVGGTCLNVGCIPTKALLASSSLISSIKEAKDFGIHINGEVEANFDDIMNRKNKVVSQLISGIEFLFEKRGIKLVNGFGKLVDTNKIEVNKEDGSKELVEADKIILANGSQPVILPMFPYDGDKIITSDEALNLKDIPKSLLIVGGGVIGCEFGQFFRALGTEVTIVEMFDQLLPLEDKDVAKQLQRQFKKDKIKVMTGVKIEKCEIVDNEVVATLSNGKEVKAEKALLSIGRKPYLDNSGIEDIGIQLERGKIIVNENLETNVKGIYAIGDIINTPFLAHVASKEGLVAAQNAVCGNSKTVNYAAVPRCVYTEPEVAGVGKTEKELQENGIEYNTGQFDFRALGKAQAIGHFQGFIKILADKNDKIIGASIVGPHATDLLTELSLAVHLGLTVEEVGDVIHAHPTLSEGIMEALHDVHGECVHAAPKLAKA